MKILYVTSNPYLPQMYSGLATSTDQTCRSLLEKGHKVAVLASLMPDGLLASKSRIKMFVNRKLIKHKVSRDEGLGYPVWRTWFPWQEVEYVAQQEKPDLIVIMSGAVVRTALAVKPVNIPILVQLHDVEFSLHGGDFAELGNISCIANSYFTAKKYYDAYGVNPAVVYPFIALENYRTVSTRENITFINPFPQKGRHIAIQIARLCPEIPFVFVEGWPISPQERPKFMQELQSIDNITFIPSQKDMRNIYGKCRILLVPSIWEEAYGRVVTEAQASGIPVIASNRGGLPEAVGPGGILIDPNAPVEEWVTATKRLWEDSEYYAALSMAATAYANRPEISYSYQLATKEELFKKVIAEFSLSKV